MDRPNDKPSSRVRRSRPDRKPDIGIYVPRPIRGKLNQGGGDESGTTLTKQREETRQEKEPIQDTEYKTGNRVKVEAKLKPGRSSASAKCQPERSIRKKRRENKKSSDSDKDRRERLEEVDHNLAKENSSCDLSTDPSQVRSLKQNRDHGVEDRVEGVEVAVECNHQPPVAAGCFPGEIKNGSELNPGMLVGTLISENRFSASEVIKTDQTADETISENTWAKDTTSGDLTKIEDPLLGEVNRDPNQFAGAPLENKPGKPSDSQVKPEAEPFGTTTEAEERVNGNGNSNSGKMDEPEIRVCLTPQKPANIAESAHLEIAHSGSVNSDVPHLGPTLRTDQTENNMENETRSSTTSSSFNKEPIDLEKINAGASSCSKESSSSMDGGKSVPTGKSELISCPEESSNIQLRAESNVGVGDGRSSPVQPAEGIEDDEEDDDEDSWFTKFDDIGNCLDSQLEKELSLSLKKQAKVTVQQPQFDYYNYKPNDDFNYEDYEHVLEICNFPPEFKTEELMTFLSEYRSKGCEIIWVDDTHALAVFASSTMAFDALKTHNNPMVKLRPLTMATRESKFKARHSVAFALPYKERPATSASAARRLVAGALGLKTKLTKEQRDIERKKLRDAKDKRNLDKQQKNDIWEGNF